MNIEWKNKTENINRANLKSFIKKVYGDLGFSFLCMIIFGSCTLLNILMMYWSAGQAAWIVFSWLVFALNLHLTFKYHHRYQYARIVLNYLAENFGSEEIDKLLDEIIEEIKNR